VWGWSGGGGHDERERRRFFHEKVPGFHSEACEWPLGGLWDNFLALWSSGIIHVEELLI